MVIVVSMCSYMLVVTSKQSVKRPLYPEMKYGWVGILGRGGNYNCGFCVCSMQFGDEVRLGWYGWSGMGWQLESRVLGVLDVICI